MWLNRIRSKRKATATPNTKNKTVLTYRAHDEWDSPENEYTFEYKRVAGVCRDSWTWRIHILSKPEHFIPKDYNNVKGRWIPDKENGEKFVCWDKNITQLEDAIQISKVWADLHQRYIATGNFHVWGVRQHEKML